MKNKVKYWIANYVYKNGVTGMYADMPDTQIKHKVFENISELEKFANEEDFFRIVNITIEYREEKIVSYASRK